MALKVGELFAELKIEDQGADKQLDQAHGNLQKVEKQAGRTEGSLSKLGAMFKNIGKLAAAGIAAGIAAVGAFAAGVTTLVSKTAAYADEVAKSSRLAGIASDDFQELRYALGQTGIGGEEFTGMLRRMNRRLGLAADGTGAAVPAFESLDIALRDANGQVRDTGEVLDETLPKLAAIESDAERAALASQIFGEDAGPKLSASLSEGVEGIDQARERAQELGIVLGEDTLEQAEKFNDMWDDVKQQALGFAYSMGAELLPVFTERFFPFIQQTAMPVLSELADWLGPKIKAGIDVGVDAVRLLYDVIQNLITTATGFRDWVQGILDNGDVLNGFLQGLPGWFQTAVSSIHGMMTSGGVNAIRAYAQGIIDGANSYVTQAVNYVSDLIAAYLVGQSPPKEGPLSEVEQGGRNTMEAYSQGLVEGAEGASEAADLVRERLDAVDESAELQAGRAGLQAAEGDLEAMERVAGDVDGKISDINRTVQELELEIAGIDREIEAINEAYDEQIQPLEDQLELLNEQYDLQNQRKDLETDLAQAQADAAKLAAIGDPERRAEIAADMELLDIEQKRLSLEDQIAEKRAELEGGGDEELTDAERERLELKERQLEISQEETEQKLRDADDLTKLEEDRLKLKLDELDADLRANKAAQEAKPEELTDEERKRVELELQELELRKELAGMVDEEAKAEAEGNSQLLDDKEKQRKLTEDIASIEGDIAALPIEEQIKAINEEREKELDPLNEQKQALEDQVDDLGFQRQQWQLLKTDVDNSLEPLQEAAREAEKMARELEKAEGSAKGLANTSMAERSGEGFDPAGFGPGTVGAEGGICAPGEVMAEDGSCVSPSFYGDGASGSGGGGDSADGDLEVPEVHPDITAMGEGGGEPEPLETPPLPGSSESPIQPEDQEPIGERFGESFADGFIGRIGELVKNNLGRILGASIGAALGGLVGAAIGMPAVGAAIGGPLGALIGDKLQDSLSEQNIDFSVLTEKGGLVAAFDGLVALIREQTPKLTAELTRLGQEFVDWIGPQIGPLLSRAGELLSRFALWISTEGQATIVEHLAKWGAAFLEWVAPRIPPLIAELGKLLERLGTWAVNEFIPYWREKLKEWGQALVDWVGPRIGPLLKELGLLLIELGAWISTEAMPAIKEKLWEWGEEFVAWVEPQILPLLSALGDLLADLGTWITDTALPKIKTKLSEWGAAFLDWIRDDVLPDLIDRADEISSDLLTWITDTALPNIKEKLLEWASAFLDWIADDVIPELPGKLGEILTTLSEWVGDSRESVHSTMKDIGEAVVTGIWDGIKSLGGWLSDQLTSWVDDNVPGPIRDALDILSPSRVMARLGEQSAQGLMAGMDDEQLALMQKSRDMADMIRQGVEDAGSGIRMPAIEIAPPQLAMAGNQSAAIGNQIETALTSMREMHARGNGRGPRELVIHNYLGDEPLETMVVDIVSGEMRKR